MSDDTTDFAVGLTGGNCGVPYPADPPIECFTELVNSIRSGTLLTDAACNAWHGWNVGGFALKMSVGDPHDDHPPLIGSTVGEPLTDEQAADVMQQAAEGYSSGQHDTYSALPIPWALLASWALKLLLERLSK